MTGHLPQRAGSPKMSGIERRNNEARSRISGSHQGALRPYEVRLTYLLDGKPCARRAPNQAVLP